MLIARAFKLESAGPIYVVDYCIDGVHVHEVGDGLIAIGTRREVTPCDGSCKAMPVLKEQEFSERHVEALRKLLQETPLHHCPKCGGTHNPNGQPLQKDEVCMKCREAAARNREMYRLFGDPLD